ncbi:MAG: hypothetical protein KF715_19920 [Candidatus Didemnitutus sp.]|nr:hypothetical protein [Candidatus Didemnitutus sp.]
MKKRPSTPTRSCLHCGAKFDVNPRIGRKHRFCSASECRAAAKRRSQGRWLSKPENAGYFKGPSNALRSRLWRAANPRRRRRKDGSRLRLFGGGLQRTLRSAGAQEMNERQLALFLGLVSILARSGEQESIAAKIREIMLAGEAVLRCAGGRR